MCAEELLKTASEKALELKCEWPGLSLEGRIPRHLALMQGNDDKAEYTSWAKEMSFNAAPLHLV